jgi:hypothetical protein
MKVVQPRKRSGLGVAFFYASVPRGRSNFVATHQKISQRACRISNAGWLELTEEISDVEIDDGWSIGRRFDFQAVINLSSLM